MQADLLKLLVVFIVIIGLVILKRTLTEAIAAAIVVTIFFSRIPILTALKLAARAVYAKLPVSRYGVFSCDLA